ncbi:MAG: hypothetical protein WB996_09530 [Ignavibacteriaceae bacterium]
MIEIDALKKNWQNQKPAAENKYNPEKIASDSFIKLKKFEKKQFRINIGKTIGMGLMILYLFQSMLLSSTFSVIKLVGVSWIVLSVIYFLIIYWKMQLKVNKLNVQGNSLDFIDEVLENFTIQKKFFKEKFWIFGATLLIGLNILYVDLLKDLTIPERIGFHFLLVVLMLAMIWGGIKIRMFRFRREYDPIIKELIKIKEDLKDKK